MDSAGDDKQKINSGDKLPREQEYICEMIIFTNTDLLNIMLP